MWEYQAFSHCSDSSVWDGLDMFTVCFMAENIPYGEMTSSKRPTGHLHLWYKDTWKQELKAYSIDVSTWEA